MQKHREANSFNRGDPYEHEGQYGRNDRACSEEQAPEKENKRQMSLLQIRHRAPLISANVSEVVLDFVNDDLVSVVLLTNRRIHRAGA